MARSGWSLLVAAAVLSGLLALDASIDRQPRAESAEGESSIARWPAHVTSVRICSRQHDRPEWLSARDFRSAVLRAANFWNGVHESISLAFTGDCSAGTTISPAAGVVPVAWHSATFEPSFDSDSVTFLITRRARQRAGVDIQAASILIDPDGLDVVGSTRANTDAVRALIGHELGHLLGLRHSAIAGDLLFDGPVTARHPSIGDRLALRAIYCPVSAGH